MENKSVITKKNTHMLREREIEWGGGQEKWGGGGGEEGEERGGTIYTQCQTYLT